MRYLYTLIVLVIAIASPAHNAAAHEIKPAVVTITPSAGQSSMAIEFKLNIEAIVAKIGPKHTDTDDSPQAELYNTLRQLPSEQLETRFRKFSPTWLNGIALEVNGKRVIPKLSSVKIPPVGDTTLYRNSTLGLVAAIPQRASKLTWRYAPQFGPNILRVITAGDKPVTKWLKDGATSPEINFAKASTVSRWTIAKDYIVLGFTHIIPKGLDHILFVLGIFLLSTHLRPLIMQVTAFTLAHTITLALGLYGIVNVSPNIVEPLIALSIAYVAIENIMTSKLNNWRTTIVFGFGLLHGLGFAGVLKDIGLPQSEYVTGLISFNVGVEFGQLAVILIAWLATGLWFASKPWYRSRIVIPASVAIAATGLYWTWERIAPNI